MKKFFLTLMLFITLAYSQDTIPPAFNIEYCPWGCIEVWTDSEVNFDTGTGSIFITFQGLYDISGVQSATIHLISPSGYDYSLQLYGQDQAQGNLFQYSPFYQYNGGQYVDGIAEFTLPYDEFEMGEYQFIFEAQDYVGNTLIMEDDDFDGILWGTDGLMEPYFTFYTDTEPEEDTTAPEFNHDGADIEGCSVFGWIDIWTGSEVNFDTGTGSIFITFQGLHDISGVQSATIHLISPSGYDYSLQLYGQDQAQGNLFQYSPFYQYVGGQCAEGMAEFTLPYDEFEMGEYQFIFEAQDINGNTLIMEDNDFDGILWDLVDGGLMEEPYFTFYTDTEPEEDTTAPEMTGLIDVWTDSEVNFDNGPGNIAIEFQGFYDISGVQSVTINLISPSGDSYFLRLYGQDQAQGNLLPFSSFYQYVGGQYASGIAEFIIPEYIFELGTYQLIFEVQDYVGNTLIMEDDDFDGILWSTDGLMEPYFTFTTQEELTTINPFENYSILTWDWGNGSNIIIRDTAVDIFNTGDTLYVYDDEALISDNCEDSEIYGPGILSKHIFSNDDDNNFNLYCNAGIDECDQYNYRYPGYIEGNPMLFSYYDNSNNTYYDLIPEFGSGNGLFGVPFADTLKFKYYDSINNMIYDINENILFEPDMILGNAIDFFEFSIDEDSGITSTIPDWDFYANYYEYNGNITCSIEGVSPGDQIMAYVGGDIRGTMTAQESPFNTTVFLLTVYGNPSSTTVSSFDIGDVARINLSNNISPENNSRSTYKYNLYKNNQIVLEGYTENFYFDYTIDENTETCYEVFLIDNYNNSEFLSTGSQCFYYEVETDIVLGDMNEDGVVNVIDVVAMVSIILSSDDYSSVGDVNQDGMFNVIDIVMVVDWILN